MNKKKKIIIVSFFFISSMFFLLLIFPTNSIQNAFPFYQSSMVKATLEWARLAEFPEQVEKFEIKTYGSSFSREFRGSFKASNADIAKWMTECTGLQDAKMEIISTDIVKYIITPGGGAQYAEVVIDFDSGEVTFQTYWS